MYQTTRVVICYVGATESLHRIVVAMCEAAWDAGAELRVRRVGEIGTADDSADNAGRPAFLRELETLPPAAVEDLEWSDVALLGIALLDGEIPRALDRFFDVARRRWRAGGLADKLHYVFSPPTTRHDASRPIDVAIAGAQALGRAAAEGTLTIASTGT